MSLHTQREEDIKEIEEKDFENMYLSLAKNWREYNESKFNIWMSNRDDDFELDIWDFRILQEFIKQEMEETIFNIYIKIAEENIKRLKLVAESYLINTDWDKVKAIEHELDYWQEELNKLK